MAEPTNQTIAPKEITFANGQTAKMITPQAGTPPAKMVRALGLEKPQGILYTVGGAGLLDETYKPRLEQLFSRGVARVAIETGTLVIDGGTQSGVMEIMGRAIADHEHQAPLLGVSPAGLVTYPGGPAEDEQGHTPLDPNHSHFVLVDTDQWGGETDTMIGVAAVLAQGTPIVTILVNGGGIAKQEILRSVRKGWPIVVINGSGRLADEIAGLWQEKPDFIPDPILAEIIAEGNIHLFPLEGTVPGIRRLLSRLINDQTRETLTLEMAWDRFSTYDFNAGRQQQNFNRLQYWILGLGVLATLLVVIQATVRPLGLWFNIFWVRNGLHYLIVALPITISALIAAANYFNAGNKWVLLRGSAEAIKREIFRYRAQAEIYSKAATTRTSAEIKLSEKIEMISRHLMQTDVNLAALQAHPYKVPPTHILAEGDNGLTFLSTAEYLTHRLDDQLNFYRRQTLKLARTLRYLQWLIYIFGGLGTLLAALGFDLWIAVTTALVSALTTYLNYLRIERTLVTYNQSATDLANVKAWWLALSAEAQASQKNIDKLVNHTEQIVKNEHAGWVQEMQDALADLRAEQTGDEDQTQRDTIPANEETEAN